MPRTRLKVCCIQSPAEAAMAMSAGADALGLVAEMPTGPGPITDDAIAAIARTVTPPVATFLLSCRRDADGPDGLIEHVRQTGCNTLQLCGLPRNPAATFASLRRAQPLLKLVQVIHVQDNESLAEAAAVAPHVDALLLDSGRTRSGNRELGGTARTHDWFLSAQIIRNSPVPVFLAGGLTATNIADAVRQVRPFGVDLCNGVRTAGSLDPVKLIAFVAALRAADESLT